MVFGYIVLETAGERELPAPAWAIGLIAFLILTVLMLITLAIGKGRSHS